MEVVVKETDPTNFEEKFDDYYEEDDDYFNTALKTNTKKDPLLVKPKRKPIRDIQLTDELPPMPPKHELLDKPNDSNYERQEKEIKGKIEFHKSSIKKLREKIQEEKLGVVTPEQKKLNDERNGIFAELDEMKKEMGNATKNVAAVRSQLADLKAEKDTISREIDVYTVDALNVEVKKIQDRLGYGQLSLTEEKNLIEKKRKLETQREKIK